MAYRYSPNHALLNQSAQVLGASVTARSVSNEFRISHAGSLNLLVGIKCTGLTAGAGITAKLQSSFYGQTGADWVDGNSVSLTGNGWFYIRMNVQTSADQAKLPLGDVGRIVVTSGAGSAVTVSELLVLQGL
jgi:hypothetical protein